VRGCMGGECRRVNNGHGKLHSARVSRDARLGITN
jgi:hypothetical protein